MRRFTLSLAVIFGSLMPSVLVAQKVLGSQDDIGIFDDFRYAPFLAIASVSQAVLASAPQEWVSVYTQEAFEAVFMTEAVYVIFGQSQEEQLGEQQRKVFQEAFSSAPALSVPVFWFDLGNKVPETFAAFPVQEGLVLGFREGNLEVIRTDLMTADQVLFLSEAVLLSVPLE